MAQSDREVVRFVGSAVRLRANQWGDHPFYRSYTVEDVAHAGPQWQKTISKAVIFEEAEAESVLDSLRQWGWAVDVFDIIETKGPRGGLRLETR